MSVRFLMIVVVMALGPACTPRYRVLLPTSDTAPARMQPGDSSAGARSPHHAETPSLHDRRDGAAADGEPADGETRNAATVDASPGGSDAVGATSDAAALPIAAATDAPTCRAFDGLTNQRLIDALYQHVRGHTALGYAIARDHMYGRREPVIDIFDGKLECVYTGREVDPDGTRTPGGMNTEHSWPQSHGSKEEPARSDLHHLFVTDQGVNSRRSNYHYGDTTCDADVEVFCTWEGEAGAGEVSQLGVSPSGERVFRVRSERRGDIARAQFYFATRYSMAIGPETEATLKRWHLEDPPDARERLRNDRIQAVQGNRNPFVDCPSLVGRIADF